MNLAVTGYKINTQKSLAFLYTNNEKSETEIKESIPFTFATKRTKYLGINIPKGTKELYTENYKTLMKEIQDDKKMERYFMFLDREDPLEKGMTTHSGILAWRIPWSCIVHAVSKSWTPLTDFHIHHVLGLEESIL